MSSTSFGGGGGGGSYKTTAFIHGAFSSELGVDKSEGAGMHSLEMRTSLLPLGWGTGHFTPLLVSETLQLSFFSRRSPHLPLGSGGRSPRAGDCFGSIGEED